MANLVPINNLGELWVRWLSLLPGQGRGFIDISHESFTEKTVNQLGVTAGRNTPLSTDAFLKEFDEDEPDGVWPFRQLVGSLMWLANQTRPDISNAVRAVAIFCACPQAQALEGRERDFGVPESHEWLRYDVPEG